MTIGDVDEYWFRNSKPKKSFPRAQRRQSHDLGRGVTPSISIRMANLEGDVAVKQRDGSVSKISQSSFGGFSVKVSQQDFEQGNFQSPRSSQLLHRRSPDIADHP